MFWRRSGADERLVVVFRAYGPAAALSRIRRYFRLPTFLFGASCSKDRDTQYVFGDSQIRACGPDYTTLPVDVGLAMFSPPFLQVDAAIKITLLCSCLKR